MFEYNEAILVSDGFFFDNKVRLQHTCYIVFQGLGKEAYHKCIGGLNTPTHCQKMSHPEYTWKHGVDNRRTRKIPLLNACRKD